MTTKHLIALLVFCLIGMAQPAYGAIAYDAASTYVLEATGDFAFDHTPVGTPRGIIVFVLVNLAGTDEITGVTYGGDAMTEVANSPVLDTSGELGGAHCFFLGTSIPTGTQSVSVTTCGTATEKDAACISLTADQ